MSEITSSLSQVLKNIKENLNADVELFDFPNTDIGCALSIDKITSTKRTGDYFTIGVSLLCECRVSESIALHNLIAVELSADIFDQVQDNTFGCTGMIPKNIAALPYSLDENFTSWVVTWEQEFFVRGLNAPTD